VTPSTGPKGSASVPGDRRIGDGQIGDGQIGDGQIGDGQIGDGQIGDGQIGDGQIGDGQKGAGLEVDVRVERRHFEVSARFEVPPGERFGLFGPSGAGKSTLLSAIAGLVGIDAGRITLAGRTLSLAPDARAAARTWRPRRAGAARAFSVPLHLRRVGLLRQNAGLFPHMTVAENIGYGADPSLGDLAHAVNQVARLVGVDNLLDAHPAALSGGQCQRVALARVLASRFDVLLLDEPFRGLDSALRVRLASLTVEEASRRAVPAVLVTHDLAEAQSFCSKVGIMDRGRLLQVGDPQEVVLRPASMSVARMVGYRAFVPLAATLSAAASSSVLAPRSPTVGLPFSTPAPSARCLVGLHPDRITMVDESDAHNAAVSGELSIRARIASSRPAGAGIEVDLALPDGSILPCRLPVGRPVPQHGDPCTIAVADPPLFEGDGRAVFGQDSGQDLDRRTLAAPLPGRPAR